MNDIIEEHYGFPQTDRTTLCRHGSPVALCNSCGDDLADTVEETIEELIG